MGICTYKGQTYEEDSNLPNLLKNYHCRCMGICKIRKHKHWWNRKRFFLMYNAEYQRPYVHRQALFCALGPDLHFVQDGESFSFRWFADSRDQRGSSRPKGGAMSRYCPWQTGDSIPIGAYYIDPLRGQVQIQANRCYWTSTHINGIGYSPSHNHLCRTGFRVRFTVGQPLINIIAHVWAYGILCTYKGQR